jgi:hypothetical protein
VVRTQIQFTDRQLKALRQASAATGRSISDLVRQSVDSHLASRVEVSREERLERALRVAGKFASDETGVSVSEDHDRHLAKAFGG